MKSPPNNPLRLTRAQSRAIDRIAVEKYHIPSIVLMENAARAAVDLVNQLISHEPAQVKILCGPGNNGGDGLAIARHLHNRGHGIRILLLADPAKYKGNALINWKIIEAMQIPTAPLTTASISNADLLIDALFGTGLTEAPRPPFGEIAAAVNESRIPILSIDIPSGLDCDTGLPLTLSTLRAAHTITFVAEKIGFANSAAKQYLGQITVADIGCPKECIDEAIRR
jgi:NAD(P)H-hydrate epimerase